MSPSADDPPRPGRADEQLRRAPIVRVYDRGDALTILGHDGLARRLEGESAALARAVLDLLAAPRTRAEVAAEIARLAGLPSATDLPRGPLEELVTLLLTTGVVTPVRDSPPGTPPPVARARPRVVLGVSGAVAAVDTPQLARALLAQGYAVRGALTKAARRFVPPAALRAVLHAPVYTGFWRGDDEAPVPHVNLAEWADLVLVAPASARTLARLAAGDFADLVAAIALGTQAPVVLAPSMNEAMYRSPAVQRNLERLRADGFYVLHPALGVEVAHAPEARRPMLGPAPTAGAVVDQVRHILAETLAARSPASAEEWDRAWATLPDEQLPWHTAELDPDLQTALDAHTSAPSRRLIDLGAGDGTAAIAAARRGFDVVALDVSPHALERARGRAKGLSITWVQDDAAAPRLWGQFDVLLDRGLLHVLPPARRVEYATTLGRLAAPDAWLYVKTHAPEEGARHRTRPPSSEELFALLGNDFETIAVTPSTLPGPGSSPKAVLYSLRRR